MRRVRQFIFSNVANWRNPRKLGKLTKHRKIILPIGSTVKESCEIYRTVMKVCRRVLNRKRQRCAICSSHFHGAFCYRNKNRLATPLTLMGKHIIMYAQERAVIEQSRVKTFLPGFGNGWLKYCAVVHFWGEQRNILRVIIGT